MLWRAIVGVNAIKVSVQCYYYNMKTTYSREDVRQLLQTREHANPDSIQQLAEGHNSQALSFEVMDGSRYVVRISKKEDDFLADKYASEHFGDRLPVPKVVEIGGFGDSAHYCITEYAKGEITDAFSDEELQLILPTIHDVFAQTFHTDISTTTGYGEIDTRTGNAKSKTWRESLEGWLAKTNVKSLKGNARNIGIDPALIDEFIGQFHANIAYASEVRRLFHGDPGFNNLLIDNGQVSAVIDWERMGYGDWMRDFAWLDFWWLGRFGDATEFALKYDLEADNIPERRALHWSVNALSTIQFADEHKSESTASWLREHVADKRVALDSPMIETVSTPR